MNKSSKYWIKKGIIRLRKGSEIKERKFSKSKEHCKKGEKGKKRTTQVRENEEREVGGIKKKKIKKKRKVHVKKPNTSVGYDGCSLIKAW